jgi:hypothetical protein
MLARFKVLGLTFFMAVALCLSIVGFSGSAFAYANPHISTPQTHVKSDFYGCAGIRVTGKGFTAYDEVQIGVWDKYNTAYAYNGYIVYADPKGRISTDVTVCGLYYPKDVVYIEAYDYYSGFYSNVLHVKAN